MTSEIERRVKILEYLRENSLGEKAKKINKSDVMRHLEGISRLNTTHRTIEDLRKEGKIKMVKDKPKSQTHYLTINQDNEFNKIYNSLLEIDTLIDKMDSFATATRELKRKDNEDESTAGHILETNYRIPNEAAIDHMLHFLLVKVSERHLNDQDSEILYRKIVRLFQKMLSQRGFRDLKEDNKDYFNDFASRTEKDIKQDVKYFQKYASIYDKYKVDFGVRDDLLEIIKNFREKFLS